MVRFVSISCVIIDEIVRPDESRVTNCLGGGGMHGAMGMRVWSENVGVSAKIGTDFPVDLMKTIAKTFDTNGLDVCDMQTVRSCQIFDMEGNRTDVIIPELKDFSPLQPDVERFPKEYDDLLGVHIHGNASEAAR